MSQTNAAIEKPRHLRWNEVQGEHLNPSIFRRYVSGSNSTVARFELKQGVQIPRHEHHNEQICCVFAGALKFMMDDAEYLLRAGDLLVIPPNVPHAAEAVEDCLVFDFFSPARADWETRQDQYLRASK